MIAALRQRPDTQREAPIFQATLLPGAHMPSPGALGISLFLHAAGLPLLPLLFLYSTGAPPETVQAQLVPPHVTEVILRLPPVARPLAQPRLQTAPPPAAPPAPRPAAAPKARPRTGPYLLRPAPQIVDRRLPRDLPTMAAWTGALPPPPEPIVPGTPNPVPAAPPPAVKPSLEPPVANAPPGEIAIRRPRPARTLLTLPPSSPSAVTLMRSEEAGALAALPGATQAGVPVAVVSVSSTPSLPGAPVRVPEAQSLARPAEKQDDTPSSPPVLESAPARNATPAAVTPTGNGVSNGGDSLARAGSATVPGPAAPAPPSPDAPIGESSRTFTLPAGAGVIRVADLPDGSRRLTYPNDGKFDIVVMGAGSPAGVPAPETILRGRPIYTAYLQVGASRDWILQFCLEGAAPKRTGMVLSLGEPARLEPPYVQLAQVPATRPSDAKGYSVYHFRITAEGSVRDPRAVSIQPGESPTLLAMLAMWRFRPASRSGENLALEALLLVPPGPLIQ